MDDVVAVVHGDDTDLEQLRGMVGADQHVQSGWSGVVIAATALVQAWRMLSSDIPCLRALGTISTATTLVVTRLVATVRGDCSERQERVVVRSLLSLCRR